MAFSSKSDMEEMNAACGDQPRGNADFENIAFSIPDYYMDYKRLTSELKIPVLFFYGKQDWMAGPEHFKGVNFPNLILWGADVGHMMPFLKNKPELEMAINSYIAKNKF
jgi:proline iminopeptidase